MRIKNHKFLLFLAAFVVLFTSLGVCFAANMNQQDFSADMISRAKGENYQAKIYCSKDKMRTDIEGTIMIARFDKNLTWIVMPSEKMYMEQAIDRNKLPKTSKEVEGEQARVLIGKETIDGKSVEKFKVTYVQAGVSESMYQWLIDTGFPIKMEAIDGSWTVEYKNLSFKSQPENLFEPPAGFSKFAMPFSSGAGSMSMDDIMKQVGAEK